MADDRDADPPTTPSVSADPQSDPHVAGAERLQRLRMSLAALEQRVQYVTEEIADQLKRLGLPVDKNPRT